MKEKLNKEIEVSLQQELEFLRETQGRKGVGVKINGVTLWGTIEEVLRVRKYIELIKKESYQEGYDTGFNDWATG